jgi:hypothetical protein
MDASESRRLFEELVQSDESGEDLDMLKLGDLHRTGAILAPWLLQELQSAEVSRRRLAAAVLGQLDGVEPHLADLLAAAEDQEPVPAARAMLVDALGFRGRLPRSPRQSYDRGGPITRVSLAKALAAASHDLSDEGVLALLLNDDSVDVLAWAALAAANRLRAGAVDFTPHLLRLLGHPESEVAGEALVGLAGAHPAFFQDLIAVASARGDLAPWMSEAGEAAEQARC